MAKALHKWTLVIKCIKKSFVYILTAHEGLRLKGHQEGQIIGLKGTQGPPRFFYLYHIVMTINITSIQILYIFCQNVEKSYNVFFRASYFYAHNLLTVTLRWNFCISRKSFGYRIDMSLFSDCTQHSPKN